MKEDINFNRFYDAFELRRDNFSYDGLYALYEYLIQYEEDTGQEIELDVISLCCDYNEYKDLNEYLKDYDNIHKSFIEDKKEEFNDLINSDDKFNYKDNEFLDWIIDYYSDEMEEEISNHTTLIKIKDNLNEGFIIGTY